MFGDREIKLDLYNRGVVERGRKARPISKLAATLMLIRRMLEHNLLYLHS
jgi:hypothetical protein